MGKPLWKKMLWLFIVFAIAGAIKIIYQEITYKKKTPLESMNREWQSLGPTTGMFGGQSYTGDFFFDRKNMEKVEGNIILWVKIKTHNPIVEQRGKETYRCDEMILRWIVDCGAKEVKTDYIVLYWQGKKQYGEKRDDLKWPIMKYTNAYLIYELFCF